MVDQSNIPQIAALFNEKQQIERALAVPDPRINQMEWSGVILNTRYMEAPSIMYDTIRGLLRDRSRDIDDELSRMGITTEEVERARYDRRR